MFDWNSDVDILSLLTSSEEINRIKGEVLWTLRNDSTNTLIGSELFFSKAQKIITKRIRTILDTEFNKTIMDDDIYNMLDHVNVKMREAAHDFLAVVPSINIVFDRDDPYNFRVEAGDV